MTDQEINEAVARRLGTGYISGRALGNGYYEAVLRDYLHDIKAARKILDACERWKISKTCGMYIVELWKNEKMVAIGYEKLEWAICLAFLKLEV